jgi:glycosyltransferase involved in cell wall biosynthesis
MKVNLRICYLTFDSLSEGVGQSQIVPLVFGLTELGHKVTVISFEKKSNPTLAMMLSDSNITWLSYPFGKPGIKGITRRVYLMTKNLPDADVYHCRSDLPVIAMLFRGIRPFLWDVRGLWYEQKILIDQRPHSSFLYYFLRKIEKYAARNASAINVLANPILEVLKKRNHVIPKIRTVIPTSVDLEKFRQQQLHVSNNMILLSGTFNTFYDMETTLAILREFNKQGFEIEWARGFESNSDPIDESFVKVVTLEHTEMPAKIASSSFGIAVCRTDCVDVLKGVMPTKVAEFLSVGRPVIVSRGMGDLDRLISQSRAGIVIETGMTAVEIVARARALLSDVELSYRCRKLAESHFSMKTAVLEFENSYRRIVTKPFFCGP